MAKEDKQPFPLQYIKGIGPKRAEALAEEGLLTPANLLQYYPKAYIDRNAAVSIKNLVQNLKNESSMFTSQTFEDIKMKTEATVIAKVTKIRENNFGKNRRMLSVRVADASLAAAEINFWNGIDYFSRIFKMGQLLAISGTPELDSFSLKFTHPDIDIIEEEDEELYASGAILPKYKITDKMRSSGLALRNLRQIILTILEKEIDNIEETLPDFLIEKRKFPDIKTAVTNLHFPDNQPLLEISRQRMKFEEIFFYELQLAVKRQIVKDNTKGALINPKSANARKLFDSLPFELTGDQKKVLREIAADFESGKPMNRLLQGDVGSGKTIVAILTILMAIDSGFQTAFLAPTEILAEQHYRTLSMYLEPLGIKIIQLVGGQKKRLRREILEQIESGEANIIVGTHALFQSEIFYNNLGLVIIDEQHRFGVAQRAELINLGRKSMNDGEKSDYSPHILVMSATPIPRTLSLTVYGDLDVSIIRQMPLNRKPIITKVVFESRRDEVFDFIKKEIKKGRQAYIVYPLVEKSEKLELKAATEHFEVLRNDVFPGLNCGLLHGQMFWYEKEEAMNSFLNKEFDILVATTVIEVGIDVPNATVMLIENAERFGLSTLHQLRGRVGRGVEQSYCFLATKDHFQYQLRNSANPMEERKSAFIRLKSMEETTDGFKISEIDLKLRGPGDMLGTKQSGLPDFKFIDLINDSDIISQARNEAFAIIDKDPQLRLPENTLLRNYFLKKSGDSKDFYEIA